VHKNAYQIVEKPNIFLTRRIKKKAIKGERCQQLEEIEKYNAYTRTFRVH